MRILCLLPSYTVCACGRLRRLEGGVAIVTLRLSSTFVHRGKNRFCDVTRFFREHASCSFEYLVMCLDASLTRRHSLCLVVLCFCRLRPIGYRYFLMIISVAVISKESSIIICSNCSIFVDAFYLRSLLGLAIMARVNCNNGWSPFHRLVQVR